MTMILSQQQEQHYTTFDDGVDYFERQTNKEKELVAQLTRRYAIPKRLFTEHSLQEIHEFLTSNEKTIVARPYLFRVDTESMLPLVGSPNPTLSFAWTNEARHSPLACGNAFYVFFDKNERDAAIECHGQAKESFYYLAQKKTKRPILTRVKKEPLESRQFNKEANQIVDIMNTVEETAMICFQKNSKKRDASSLTPLLDTIVSSDGLAIEPVESRAIECYKKPRHNEFRALLESLAYTARLEHELREAQAQAHAKELADARLQLELKEETIRLQEKELQLKLSENAFLKEKELFYQQQQQPLTKKVRSRPLPSTKPKRAKPPTPQIETTAVAIVAPVIEYAPPVEPDPVLLEQQRLMEAQRKEFEAVDAYIHSTLMVRDQKTLGGTPLYANMAVTTSHSYKIRTVLEILFDTLNNEKNDVYQALLEHPFFAEYRVFLHANVPALPPKEDQETTLKYIDQVVLQSDNPVNRVNLSNLLVNLWFIAKAIAHNANPTRSYEIVLMPPRRYGYAPEILRKWYPFVTSGPGTVLTEDLKMPAYSLKKGPGEGKCCSFCEMQFVAVSNGLIKHSHHLDHCDILANLSNNEYNILAVVMERKQIALQVAATIDKSKFNRSEAAAVEFARSKFMSTYTADSFLRLATEREIALGQFATCPLSNDRVRVNMSVLMSMRAESWDLFTKRIGLLDTATDEKCLGGQPIAGLMDCFQFNAPRHKAKIHMNPLDGLLYKCLVDYEGNHYMTSKKIKSKNPADQRSFAIDPITGFGDDVYYESPYAKMLDTIEPLVFKDHPASGSASAPAIASAIAPAEEPTATQAEEPMPYESNIVFNIAPDGACSFGIAPDDTNASGEPLLLNNNNNGPFSFLNNDFTTMSDDSTRW